MDFVSMLFDLLQDFEIKKIRENVGEYDDEFLDAVDKTFSKSNIIKMSKKEINEAYDSMDFRAMNAQKLDKLNKSKENGSNPKGNSTEG